MYEDFPQCILGNLLEWMDCPVYWPSYLAKRQPYRLIEVLRKD